MSREISKLLSFVLRHAPEHIGITLDDNGWTNIEILINKANQAGYNLNLEQLLETVETSDKKRFTLSDDVINIRAAQGHSVNINLALEPMQPPEQLFHGTAKNNLDSIIEKGLHAAKRQYVHLSYNEETALKVGLRHGKATVLIVNSKKMFDDGYKFFKADNGVWLTDKVPCEYIRF